MNPLTAGTCADTAWLAQAEIVEWLLQVGAPVNRVVAPSEFSLHGGTFGDSALLHAVKHAHLACVSTLLVHGANVHQLDRGDVSALGFAVTHGCASRMPFCSLDAQWQGHSVPSRHL